jgi:hypothetical protein
VLALGASGCGLSAELDRERNPERSPTPTPTPARTRAAPPPVTAAPETPPDVPVQPARGCPPSGVRFGTGRVDGAMGLRAMTLTLVNCGERPYRLDGYPFVRVLDETGAPLTGVSTAEGTDKVFMAPESQGPKPLTVAPGETAHAALYWRMGAEDGTFLHVGPQKNRDDLNIRPLEPLDIGPENILGTTPWSLTS